MENKRYFQQKSLNVFSLEKSSGKFPTDPTDPPPTPPTPLEPKPKFVN